MLHRIFQAFEGSKLFFCKYLFKPGYRFQLRFRIYQLRLEHSLVGVEAVVVGNVDAANLMNGIESATADNLVGQWPS